MKLQPILPMLCPSNYQETMRPTNIQGLKKIRDRDLSYDIMVFDVFPTAIEATSDTIFRDINIFLKKKNYFLSFSILITISCLRRNKIYLFI